MRALLFVFSLCAVSCTTVTVTRVPARIADQPMILTAGDISQPYDSLGIVQVQRSGVMLLGFFDPIGTDLDAGFHDALVPKVREMGGDGAINIRYDQTHYAPLTKAVFAVLFFLPLPSSVTVTGEVVKLRRSG